MATFRVDTKTWLRVTTAAMRAKLSRSEFIRRAVLAAIDRKHGAEGSEEAR